MKRLQVTTTAKASVTLDGLDINEVLHKAADLAHEVLEELSIYRQENDMDETFHCEDLASLFLDLIDD